MTVRDTALLLAWVGLALMGLALSGVIRQLHSLSRPRSSSEPISISGAPLAAMDDSDLAAHCAGGCVLLFADAHCSSCVQAIATAGSLLKRLGVRFLVLYQGSDVLGGLHDDSVELANRSAVFESLRIPATPYLVIVDANQRVVAGRPVGTPELVEQVLIDHIPSDLLSEKGYDG